MQEKTKKRELQQQRDTLQLLLQLQQQLKTQTRENCTKINLLVTLTLKQGLK